MTKQLRRAPLLVPFVMIASAGAALAVKVQAGPVKGAVYAGTVRQEALAMKVAKSGKTATVNLPIAPAFCEGGAGAEEQVGHAGAISKSGRFRREIAYLVRPTNRRFATVTVSGRFDGRVFQGTVKSSFTPAKSCDGQESFQARAR